MQITVDTTVTRDGYRGPTETFTGDVASPKYADGPEGLHDWIITVLEEAIRAGTDLVEGDWVEIEITGCSDRPDLVGEAFTWVVSDDD